jgi:hypothetical protein
VGTRPGTFRIGAAVGSVSDYRKVVLMRALVDSTIVTWVSSAESKEGVFSAVVEARLFRKGKETVSTGTPVSFRIPGAVSGVLVPVSYPPITGNGEKSVVALTGSTGKASAKGSTGKASAKEVPAKLLLSTW